MEAYEEKETTKMSMQSLIELAKKNIGVESDNALANAIGRSRQHLHGWKAGRSLPDVQNFARLAEAAGMTMDEAYKELARDSTGIYILRSRIRKIPRSIREAFTRPPQGGFLLSYVCPGQMRPHIYDLFGEIPVNRSDLIEWVNTNAPHIAHSESRTERYIKDWNVIDKVRKAKAEALT